MSDIDKAWDYNDPAGTEWKFRTMLDEAWEMLNEPRELELLTQIARTQGLQQKFDDAHATLNVVERRLVDTTPLVRVRYLLERGRVFNSSKQAAKSIPLFMEAMEIGQKNGLDFYAVDAIHMLAIVEPDPAKQLEWIQRAVRFAETSCDERARGWLGSLYNNIGWTLYDQKRYDEALEVFRKAIPIREQQNRPMELRIAHYSVGKTLRAMGRSDEALEIQLEQDADAQKHSQPDGHICEEVGECLLALNRAQESKAYFRRAYELLKDDKWLQRDEPGRLERIKRLSD